MLALTLGDLNKDARYCAFEHYVPSRAHLHFLLNFIPNDEIIQKRYLSLKKSLHNRITN